jgi:hypothetical protein
MALIILMIGANQPANQAGLVVRFGDDRVESYCVSFPESEITGRDLLERAGLALEIDEVGMGATVCRLDDVGCPSTNCFCACRGGNCTYWSYWRMGGDGWQYAVMGASVSQVHHGDLQGWSWGPGSVTEAIAPPQASFDAVCGEEVSLPGVSESAADDASDAPGAAETAPTPIPSLPPAGEPATFPGSYVYFGLLILLLGGLALLASRRR